MSAFEQTEARYCRRVEAAAIGGLILDPRKLEDVRPWLEPGDFAVAHYGRWYAHMCEMRDRGLPIDQVTLLAELRRHNDLGPDGRYAFELAVITERVPIAGEPTYYARVVLEESTRRHLRIAGLRLTQVAEHGDPRDAFADALLVTEAVHLLHRRWTESGQGPTPSRNFIQDDESAIRRT